jgi:hypothetical protein
MTTFSSTYQTMLSIAEETFPLEPLPGGSWHLAQSVSGKLPSISRKLSEFLQGVCTEPALSQALCTDGAQQRGCVGSLPQLQPTQLLVSVAATSGCLLISLKG